MNVNEHTFGDINTHGGGERPPHTGLAPDVLPEVPKPVLAENSHTGVSTQNALSETNGTTSGETRFAMTIPNRDGRGFRNPTDKTTSRETYQICTKQSCRRKTEGLNATKAIKRKTMDVPHWYVLRVTYGREKKAYDYLIGKHVEAYYPTITTIKCIDGKRKSVEESRLPNIFFARGTEEEIKSFVYDNVNLPYLRFYYCHHREGTRMVKEPLIVPDHQIESLKIICASKAEDIILSPATIQKFKTGQTVRVIDGVFKGVIGKIARYHGQQRVAIIIDGVLTISSAYVPSAFVKIIK